MACSDEQNWEDRLICEAQEQNRILSATRPEPGNWHERLSTAASAPKEGDGRQTSQFCARTGTAASTIVLTMPIAAKSLITD